VSATAREIGISPWARKPERKRRSPAQPARDREIIRLFEMGRTYEEIGKRLRNLSPAHASDCTGVS
jgi:hypothetical protein